MIEFSLAGLFVGIVVGATGVGGGALMTPILIIGLNVPAAVAMVMLPGRVLSGRRDLLIYGLQVVSLIVELLLKGVA